PTAPEDRALEPAVAGSPLPLRPRGRPAHRPWMADPRRRTVRPTPAVWGGNATQNPPPRKRSGAGASCGLPCVTPVFLRAQRPGDCLHAPERRQRRRRADGDRPLHRAAGAGARLQDGAAEDPRAARAREDAARRALRPQGVPRRGAERRTAAARPAGGARGRVDQESAGAGGSGEVNDRLGGRCAAQPPRHEPAPDRGPIVQPRIITQPPFEVVGLEIETAPKSPEIPALWGRFAGRITEIADAPEPQIGYGVIARFDRERTRPCYLSGVAVRPSGRAPEGMTRTEIPGGTYAVFYSSLSVLAATFDHIFGVW